MAVVNRICMVAFLLAGVGCPSNPPPRGDQPKTILSARLVCPTRDPAAMRAYDAAIDAERVRDVARAEALYKEAVQRDPAYCDAMDNLGLLFRRQGKVDQAIEWYRKSLAIQPRNSLARTNLATAARQSPRRNCATPFRIVASAVSSGRWTQ